MHLRANECSVMSSLRRNRLAGGEWLVLASKARVLNFGAPFYHYHLVSLARAICEISPNPPDVSTVDSRSEGRPKCP